MDDTAFQAIFNALMGKPTYDRLPPNGAPVLSDSEPPATWNLKQRRGDLRYEGDMNMVVDPRRTLSDEARSRLSTQQDQMIFYPPSGGEFDYEVQHRAPRKYGS